MQAALELVGIKPIRVSLSTQGGSFTKCMTGKTWSVTFLSLSDVSMLNVKSVLSHGSVQVSSVAKYSYFPPFVNGDVLLRAVHSQNNPAPQLSLPASLKDSSSVLAASNAFTRATAIADAVLGVNEWTSAEVRVEVKGQAAECLGIRGGSSSTQTSFCGFAFASKATPLVSGFVVSSRVGEQTLLTVYGYGLGNSTAPGAVAVHVGGTPCIVQNNSALLGHPVSAPTVDAARVPSFTKHGPASHFACMLPVLSAGEKALTVLVAGKGFAYVPRYVFCVFF
jgi:hypothetical protein